MTLTCPWQGKQFSLVVLYNILGITTNITLNLNRNKLKNVLPEISRCCMSVRWVSPVPGGVSTNKTSVGPQSTSNKSLWIACITIKPRQMTADSCDIRNPMDMLQMLKQITCYKTCYFTLSKLIFRRLRISLWTFAES